MTQTAQRRSDPPRRRRWSRLVLFNGLIVVVLLLLVEGLASSAYFVRDLVVNPRLAERFHTHYDSELGWVNIPNFRDPDFYGSGRGLRINAQGFRNAGPIETELPEGRVRVVCSGDSFTLGYGVADEHTWCSQLEALDRKLQTVNMGQGGYGIDQAYLWYMRDGKDLQHQVHLFAFITHDFLRTTTDRFLGYAKPVLELHDGELVTGNVPVPATSSWSLWATRSRMSLMNLASVRVSRRLAGRSNVPQAADPDDPEARRLAGAVFGELGRRHQKRGSTLVLVHLPMAQDCRSSLGSDGWRKFLRDQAHQHGWHYLDLIEPFQQLPAIEVDRMYLKPGDVDFPSAEGHFTAAGNRRVAEMILQQLKSIPEINAQMSGP